MQGTNGIVLIAMWGGVVCTLAAPPPLAGKTPEAAVYIWISDEGNDSVPPELFPEDAAELQRKKAAAPVRCGAPDPEQLELTLAYEKDLAQAADLFYSNRYEESGAVLSSKWEELVAIKDRLDISGRLLTRCFVLKMLVFKASGDEKGALEFVASAAPHIIPAALEEEDIPPDAVQYIKEKLKVVTKQSYEVGVEVYATDAAKKVGCTVWVDGIALQSGSGSIKFSGGSHSIWASCGSITGWKWKVEFPFSAGKKLRLNPEAESVCSCSDFPVIVCPRLDESAAAIGANLLVSSMVSSFAFARMVPIGTGEGLEVSEAISVEVPVPSLLTWRKVEQKRTKKTLLSAEEGTAETRGSGRSHGKKGGVASLGIGVGLGVAAIVAGASSAGLLGWSAQLKAQTHQIRDPWERKGYAEASLDAQNGGLILASVAALFLAGSVVALIVHSKEVRKMKRQGSAPFQ